MRTRTRDLVVVLPPSGITVVDSEVAHNGRYFYPNGQWFEGAGVSSFNTYRDGLLNAGTTGAKGTISDSYTTPGSFNTVVHETWKYSCPLVLVKYEGQCTVGGPGNWTADATVKSEFSTACPRWVVEWGVAEWPFMATNEQLLQEAISSVDPGVVRPRFDISQQVGEMIEGVKQLQDINLDIKRIADDITRLNRWNSPAVRRALGQKTFGQLSIVDWAGLAVHADLGYNLAIKPTVNAVKQFIAATRSARDSLEALVADEVTLHGVSKREATVNKVWGTPQELYTCGQSRVYTKTVHATIQVKFLNDLSDELVKKFDEAYFGLIPHIGTAWELTPLSFVIDMFVDLGRVAAQWGTSPIEDIRYKVLQTGWSVKDQCTVNGWTNVCDGTYTNDYRRVHGAPAVKGELVYTHYVREPKQFDVPGEFTPKPPPVHLPNLGQAKTIAELIYSMATRWRELFQVTRPGSRPFGKITR